MKVTTPRATTACPNLPPCSDLVSAIGFSRGGVTGNPNDPTYLMY